MKLKYSISIILLYFLTISTVYAVPDGTISNPYIIATADDMCFLSKAINEGNTQTVNGVAIDGSAGCAGIYFQVVASAILDYSTISAGFDTQNCPSIGSVSKPFKGHFDGNNCTITNFHLNLNTSYKAIFGVIENASISDITIDASSSIQGGPINAGVVAKASYSTIDNCVNNAIIDCASCDTIAGIAAYISHTTITNCDNTGMIRGSNHVGGVIAVALDESLVKACTNTGTLVAQGKTAGIVGHANNQVVVRECTNSALITAQSTTGGIVGEMTSSCEVRLSSNTTSLSGTQFLGGIVGKMAVTCKIDSCCNCTSISGTQYIGGIVGHVESSSEIKNCSNTGKVSGTEYVGGISGYISTSCLISQCVNMNNVSADDKVGGICGYLFNYSTLEYSANYAGTVSATSAGSAGGLVGLKALGTVNNCFSACTTSDNASSNPMIGAKLYVESDALNCYYDSLLYTRVESANGGNALSPSVLQSGIAANMPLLDINNWEIHEGFYPIPKALYSNDKVKAAAIVFKIHADDIYTSINNDFTLTTPSYTNIAMTWNSVDLSYVFSDQIDQIVDNLDGTSTAQIKSSGITLDEAFYLRKNVDFNNDGVVELTVYYPLGLHGMDLVVEENETKLAPSELSRLIFNGRGQLSNTAAEPVVVNQIKHVTSFTSGKWSMIYFPFAIDTSNITVFDTVDQVAYKIKPRFQEDIDAGLTKGYFYMRSFNLGTSASNFKDAGWTNISRASGGINKNTPYIIQFPNAYFSGKTITFVSKSDVLDTLTFQATFNGTGSDGTGNYFAMRGNPTFAYQDVAHPYILDDTGYYYLHQNVLDYELKTFSCYIEASPTIPLESLPQIIHLDDIGTWNSTHEPTGLNEIDDEVSLFVFSRGNQCFIQSNKAQNIEIYNMNGLLIQQLHIEANETINCTLMAGNYLLKASLSASYYKFIMN